MNVRLSAKYDTLDMLPSTYPRLLLVVTFCISLLGTGCTTTKTLDISEESSIRKIKRASKIYNSNLLPYKIVLKNKDKLKLDYIEINRDSLSGETTQGDEFSSSIYSISRIEFPDGNIYRIESDQEKLVIGDNFPPRDIKSIVSSNGGDRGITKLKLRSGEDVKIKEVEVESNSISGVKVNGKSVSFHISLIESINFADSKIYNLEIPSKRDVGPDGRPYRREINALTEISSASVTLRNEEKIEVGKLRVGTDSTFGVTSYKTPFKIPTPSIKRIKISGSDWRTTYRFNIPPTQSVEKVEPIAKKKQKRPQNSDKSSTREKTYSPSEVDTQIPKTEMERPDDIAVVIGNTEYENTDIPNVDYATRDAEIMKKYLTRTLGFREENVIYVENASGSAMTRIFGTSDDPKGQLHDWVRPNQSSVFIYYSGHGAPNPETGNAYLLPSDANPSYLSQNGYPLTQLYENLSKIPAQSVTVAMEACFSGTSEGGAVVQNASPAVLSVENPVMGMKNGLAFTAGATDQVASWYPEKRHGLFTYYFLKGLRGNADANSDKAVTAKEMESYLNDKVPYRAQRMHSRKQTPVVVGQNLDRVLVRYDDSEPAAQPKATLPITTTGVQQSVKNALSLPDGAVKVESATNADALQQGDVITTVNGTDLNSEDHLTEIVDQHAPGDTLELNIIREGKPRTVSVTLTASK